MIKSPNNKGTGCEAEVCGVWLFYLFQQKKITMNFKCWRFGLIILFLFTHAITEAAEIDIKNNPLEKVIVFGNSKITLTLNYSGKCTISRLTVNGQSVISGPAGIFSAITTSTGSYSTLKLASDPTINIGKNTVRVSNITYGNKDELSLIHISEPTRRTPISYA